MTKEMSKTLRVERCSKETNFEPVVNRIVNIASVRRKKTFASFLHLYTLLTILFTHNVNLKRREKR